MKIFELYSELCKIIPRELSCEWDHDGLEVCPDAQGEVKRILISLDVTDEVIDRAIKDKVDVILAHHPLFFKGVSEVSVLNPSGDRAVKLIKNNISVMTFHTRLDSVRGGVNDVLAEKLGLEDVEVVGAEGIVRVGNLPDEMEADAFARLVKFALGAPCVTLSSCGKKAKRIALIGGSGGEDIFVGRAAGADTYLTGELKYHPTISAGEYEMNLVCAGHFYTEYPVTEMLKEKAEELVPDADVEIFFSDRVEVI